METRNSNGGSLIGWVALIVSILSLVIALVAFNRSGQDIEAVIDERTTTIRSQFQADLRELETSIRQELSTVLDDDDADTTVGTSSTATSTLE